MALQHSERDLAYRQKLSKYRQWVEDGKKRPETPTDLNNWFGLFFGLLIILFVPSCTGTLLMAGGKQDKAFWNTTFWVTGVGSAISATLLNQAIKKGQKEWTPVKGLQASKDREIPEEEFLISVFDSLDEIDRALELATSEEQIYKVTRLYQHTGNQIRSLYAKVFADEKDKSRDRYARSITWNQFLDRSYSYSDNVRATRRIEAEEMNRLEGFEIALNRVEKSLLYAESLSIQLM